MRPPSLGTVRAVVIATIVLTLFHFTDNTVAIDSYPAPGWQPDWFVWVVPAGWLLFTAAGVLGYRAYRDGHYSRAHPLLVFFAYGGLISLGHFLYGGPDELTTRGVVSVLVDAVAGSAVLGVTIWSIVARRSARAAA